MKKNNFVVKILMSLILFSSVSACSKDVDAEKMMSDLEQRLSLSTDIFEKMKPDLKKLLSQKREELKASIDEQLDKGFVDLDAMSKKIDAASIEAKSNIEKALNSDQVKELKSYLASIDDEAIKEAREKLLNRMTKQLELSADQLEKLKPILRDYMEQTSELLKQALKDDSSAFDKYRGESVLLAKGMKSRLRDVLDSEQMKKLEKQLEEVRDKIKEKVFAAGN